jgi:hypothetical protein
MRGYNSLLFNLFVGLTMATHAFAWEHRLTNEDPRQESWVHFDLYKGYLIVVKGSTGPLKNLNFLVDTGATPTILDPRITRGLHLDGNPVSIAVVGGRALGNEAIVPDLEVGPIQRTQLRVVTADLSILQEELPVRIDGIVGLDVLGASPFEIDYSAHEIHFGAQPSLAISLPLHLVFGLPTIEAEIDHAPVRLLLDTGAASFYLFDARTPRSRFEEYARASRRTPGKMGDLNEKEVSLHNFRLGGAKFGLTPAILINQRKETGLEYDGLISPPALGINLISFNLKEGVVSFSSQSLIEKPRSEAIAFWPRQPQS